MAIEKIKLFQVDATEIASKSEHDAVVSTANTALSTANDATTAANTAQSTANSALSTSQIYDIPGGIAGLPPIDAQVLAYYFPRPVEFPLDLAGSVAKVTSNATASTVFSIQKDGVQFATITFAPADPIGQFSGALTSFSAGEMLTVVAPSTQDTTLQGLYFTLTGTLQ